jgi:hypothetical protein
MRLRVSHATLSREERAFTLVEALVASSTLVLVIASVMMCYLFGASMVCRQQIWMGASDDAANAIGSLMANIRAANTLQVGTYVSNVFTPAVSTNQQSGNALWIYPTTNTTPWVFYYYDSLSNNLVQTNYNGSNQSGSCKLVSANPITNDNTHPIFTEVNYMGTPLSNATTVASISIYLSFVKMQNPQIVIESGSLVDLYQIITTVSPRTSL